MFFKKSLKAKLILSFLLVVLFSFGLVAIFLDKSLEKNSLQEIRASLINQGYLIEAQLAAELLHKDNAPALEALVKKLGSKIACRLTVVDQKGRVLADSRQLLQGIAGMENHADRAEIKSALSGNIGEDIRHSATFEIDMLYVALPLMDTNKIAGALRLAIPLVSVQRTLSVSKGPCWPPLSARWD